MNHGQQNEWFRYASFELDEYQNPTWFWLTHKEECSVLSLYSSPCYSICSLQTNFLICTSITVCKKEAGITQCICTLKSIYGFINQIKNDIVLSINGLCSHEAPNLLKYSVQLSSEVDFFQHCKVLYIQNNLSSHNSLSSILCIKFWAKPDQCLSFCSEANFPSDSKLYPTSHTHKLCFHFPGGCWGARSLGCSGHSQGSGSLAFRAPAPPQCRLFPFSLQKIWKYQGTIWNWRRTRF